jgi:hypothetical protein
MSACRPSDPSLIYASVLSTWGAIGGLFYFLDVLFGAWIYGTPFRQVLRDLKEAPATLDFWLSLAVLVGMLALLHWSQHETGKKKSECAVGKAEKTHAIPFHRVVIIAILSTILSIVIITIFSICSSGFPLVNLWRRIMYSNNLWDRLRVFFVVGWSCGGVFLLLLPLCWLFFPSSRLFSRRQYRKSQDRW